MPVVLGDNLTLENNKLSAVYKELYTKLNKAYAWTNTQTSGTEGTLSCYYNNASFTKYINCSDSSNFSLLNGFVDANYGYYGYILYGEIYITYDNRLTDVKVGDKNNWVMGSIYSKNYSSQTYWEIYMWAINSNGELYRLFFQNSNGNINYTETQIGTDTTWTYLAKAGKDGYTTDNKIWGINNDYIVIFYNDSIRFTTSLSSHDIKYFSGYCNSNNINYIYGYYVDNNDDIYIKLGNNSSWTKKGNVPNIKKISPWTNYSYQVITFITDDKKAGFLQYEGSKNGIFYLDENIEWTDITWSPVLGYYNISGIGSSVSVGIFMAIGNGKLYKITIPGYVSTGTYNILYEIIDNNTNWKKLFGWVNPSYIYSNQTYYSRTFYALNSEDEIITTNTVYTTKHPIINDCTYYNCDEMTIKSNVISSTSTTITDSFLTYTRDITKDSYFSKTPPASMHETVSVMDILNATNSNN